MPLNLEKNLDTILEAFPIDVYSTEKVEVKGLKRDTRIFKVDSKKSPLIPKNSSVGKPYLIDTLSGMEIACHPHIVGKKLEKLCLNCARELIKVMEVMDLWKDDNLAILQILRGAPGYRIAEALQEKVPIISIRIQYRKGGYRSRFDDIRNIHIAYRDYSVIDSDTNEISTLLILDTYATGRSAEVAMNDLLEIGVKPRKIILYGFISIPALTRLGRLTSEKEIELVSFAIGNIMHLAHNNYDMPLYGLDEGLYSVTGELKHLGSIVDIETLKRYLPKYIAGLDQPGDWSERQNTLFNGYGYENGDIYGHLIKSIKLIDSLRKTNSKRSWYNDFHHDIASIELEKLENTLESYRKSNIS